MQLYGRKWHTTVYLDTPEADDVEYNVMYTIERAEPDVGISSDYIELYDWDGPDFDGVEDRLLDKLYWEHDL